MFAVLRWCKGTLNLIEMQYISHNLTCTSLAEHSSAFFHSHFEMFVHSCCVVCRGLLRREDDPQFGTFKISCRLSHLIRTFLQKSFL